MDLKGGMNVILEVSVPDVVKALADNKTDEAFNKAVAEAVSYTHLDVYKRQAFRCQFVNMGSFYILGSVTF